MSEKMKVLFLCTGNSCRSQMAEAILNKTGKDKFVAYSAGSHPDTSKYPETKGVNTKAYELLKNNGFDVSNLYSKNWNEFIDAKDSIDFAFTLCDKANEELKTQCPVFPGQPMTAHWGVFDPSEMTGNKDKIDRAFRDAFTIIKRRIELFIALPMDSLNSLSLKNKLDDIGKEK